MIAICAGDLKHPIVIQAEGLANDNMGGQEEDWTTVISAKARIKPLSGWERVRAQQLEAGVTHQIIIRYRPGVKESMRIVFENRIFNIRSALNVDEQKVWLEIMAEEGVAS